MIAVRRFPVHRLAAAGFGGAGFFAEGFAAVRVVGFAAGFAAGFFAGAATFAAGFLAGAAAFAAGFGAGAFAAGFFAGAAAFGAGLVPVKGFSAAFGMPLASISAKIASISVCAFASFFLALVSFASSFFFFIIWHAPVKRLTV